MGDSPQQKCAGQQKRKVDTDDNNVKIILKKKSLNNTDTGVLKSVTPTKTTRLIVVANVRVQANKKGKK